MMRINYRSSSQRNDQKAGPSNSARWGLAALALSTLLASLGTSIVNVALPSLTRNFGATFGEIQWAVLAYLLAITVFIVGMGRLGDLMGRRKLFLAGIGTFTIASALCSVAPELWILIVARAVQGVGAAAMMALSIASVRETVPKEHTGRAMGMLGSMSAIGTALGPSLGGLLITSFGWRTIFLINLPLGLIASVLAYRSMPVDRVDRTEKQPRMDYGGTLLLAITLAAYSLAMTVGRGGFGLLNATLLFAAFAGAGIFVHTQMSVPSPLVDLAILRDPRLSASLIMSLLVATVVMATLVVGPFYLSGALGLGDAAVGFAMSNGPVLAALTGVPAGRAVDRFGADRMAIAGLFGMTAGSAGLALMPVASSVWGYIVPLGIMTAGYALFQSGNNTAVMAGASSENRGLISGLLSLSRNLGLITGASLMGAIFAAASAGSSEPDVLATGMRVTFAAASAVILFSIGIYAGGKAICRRSGSPGCQKAGRTALQPAG